MPAAADGSSPERRGTSATETTTTRRRTRGRTTPVQNTSDATAPPPPKVASRRRSAAKLSSATSREPEKPSGPTPDPGESVTEAVGRDLATLPADLASSGLGMLALALARMVYWPGNSATSRSMCAGQLRDTLSQLRELVPPEVEEDALDDLTARRAARLAQ